MLKTGKRLLLAAIAASAIMTSQAWADGLISIIVNDPANPYWLTEGQVAKRPPRSSATPANVSAHKGDTNTESTLVDTGRSPTSRPPSSSTRRTPTVRSAP